MCTAVCRIPNTLYHIRYFQLCVPMPEYVYYVSGVGCKTCFIIECRLVGDLMMMVYGCYGGWYGNIEVVWNFVNRRMCNSHGRNVHYAPMDFINIDKLRSRAFYSEELWLYAKKLFVIVTSFVENIHKILKISTENFSSCM